MKLTPAPRAMLDRIARATDSSGSLMSLTILASGGRGPGVLRDLIAAGFVERVDMSLQRGSVDAVRVTAAGREALQARPA